MSLYDSADCLARLNDALARPSADDYSDTAKYAKLADAQNEVYMDIAAVCPQALFEAPTALSTADGGQTFTFASAVFPFGHIEVYPTLQSVPDAPWSEGLDYLNEGSRIRIPNNRSYSSTTLYARYIKYPAVITSSQAPSISPIQATELIVAKAAQLFGLRGALRPELAGAFAARYAELWRKWALYYKTQHDAQGASVKGYFPWQYSPDLGSRMGT